MNNEPITQEEIEEANQLLKGVDPDTVPIQSKIKGFTPLPDSIAETHGLMRAAVFGKVWRYCQMRDGVCKASLETIADGLGIDRSTVSRHIEALCQDKYLKDLTPLLKNKPHVYSDTRKMKFTINLTVAENNTTVAQSNVTVAESRMSKDSKKESKKENLAREKTPRAGEREKHRRPPDEHMKLSKAFTEITGIEWLQPKGKGWAAAEQLWNQPLDRMLERAGEQAESILRSSVKYMKSKDWPVTGPHSVEKTFTMICGERNLSGMKSAAARDPFAGLHEMMERKAHENDSGGAG